MPNVTVNEPIEASHAALVNGDDRRLRDVIRRHPGLERFLGTFRDEFGTEISPTIGMVREDAPHVHTVSAFGGFRDAVCMSAIVAGRGHAMTSRSGAVGIVHSDAFDVYPWFPSLTLEGRVGAFTPAVKAIHEVAQLRPQPTPALGKRSLSASNIDYPLLGAILARWEDCFVTGNQPIEDRRLFRALEMARAASKMPGGIDASEHDAGRAVAQWVSAFEILAHDGKHADFRSVLSLLDRVEWLRPALQVKDHEVTYRGKSVRTNLAGVVYHALYRARNDFLHGNEVTAETLKLKKCQKHVHWFSASLFRLALTAFLDLRFAEPLPVAADGQDHGRHIGRRMDFRSPQRVAEDTILVADELPRKP
jgi:hypothetical protein